MSMLEIRHSFLLNHKCKILTRLVYYCTLTHSIYSVHVERGDDRSKFGDSANFSSSLCMEATTYNDISVGPQDTFGGAASFSFPGARLLHLHLVHLLGGENVRLGYGNLPPFHYS